MEYALALGGVFAGCLMRALFPFLKKRSKAAEAGESVHWESRYLWTIVFALASSMVETMLLIPTFTIPDANVFPLAFALGWASQDILNKIVK